VASNHETAQPSRQGPFHVVHLSSLHLSLSLLFLSHLFERIFEASVQFCRARTCGDCRAGVCVQFIEVESEHDPDVSFSGSVMHGASANQVAEALHGCNDELLKSNGALINLQCISHTLSLLLYDLREKKPFDRVH
jgi:hypothetical protein